MTESERTPPGDTVQARALARLEAEHQLQAALAAWHDVLAAQAIAPLRHYPPPVWLRAEAYWAATLGAGLVLYLIGLPILLDTSDFVDLQMIWTDPVVWPLNLLTQDWFGIITVLAGLGLLAVGLGVLRTRLELIIAWHLALFVTLNIAAYATVAVLADTARPFATWTGYLVLTAVCLVRIAALWRGA